MIWQNPLHNKMLYICIDDKKIKIILSQSTYNIFGKTKKGIN